MKGTEPISIASEAPDYEISNAAALDSTLILPKQTVVDKHQVPVESYASHVARPWLKYVIVALCALPSRAVEDTCLAAETGSCDIPEEAQTGYTAFLLYGIFMYLIGVLSSWLLSCWFSGQRPVTNLTPCITPFSIAHPEPASTDGPGDLPEENTTNLLLEVFHLNERCIQLSDDRAEARRQLQRVRDLLEAVTQHWRNFSPPQRVWTTRYGQRWHCNPECRGLSRSREALEYQPCQLCVP